MGRRRKPPGSADIKVERISRLDIDGVARAIIVVLRAREKRERLALETRQPQAVKPRAASNNGCADIDTATGIADDASAGNEVSP